MKIEGRPSGRPFLLRTGTIHHGDTEDTEKEEAESSLFLGAKAVKDTNLNGEV
jgi:hypothetical protein